MCFMYVASLCSSWCLVHCSVLFTTVTGTGVWSACLCTFVLHMLRMCQHRHGGSMWKNYDMWRSRFTHSNHSSLPSLLSGLQRGMSGLWECQCAESAGGEQWLRCAASLFGRLHAAFQRGPPSAFGSVSLVDQAFAWWSVTRCAHTACSSSGLWGAADYPAVIGAWALADQRCPADCGALVIFHPLKLCSLCLLACPCLFLLAWLLQLCPWTWRERLYVCLCY